MKLKIVSDVYRPVELYVYRALQVTTHNQENDIDFFVSPHLQFFSDRLQFRQAYAWDTSSI